MPTRSGPDVVGQTGGMRPGSVPWRTRIGVPLACLLLLAGATACDPTPTSPVSNSPATCPTVFTTTFASTLASRYPGVKITAAVHDTATDCWYLLNPSLRITTASVIKAQVLGAVLLKAQRARRATTAWEQARITPMISLSWNPPTSELYAHVGSASGMAATDAAFGAIETTHTATYGLTRSSAADRTRVAERLLYGGGALLPAGRSDAWAAMTAVHPLQRWGITAGVPGTWTVALKNGFYPANGLGWRVGSTGFVRRNSSGEGYAITVMTESVGNQVTGIAAVETVSRQVAGVLAPGTPAARTVDTATCVTVRSGETWTAIATRLGVATSRATEIRDQAGGNTSPLTGQRACRPLS